MYHYHVVQPTILATESDLTDCTASLLYDCILSSSIYKASCNIHPSSSSMSVPLVTIVIVSMASTSLLLGSTSMSAGTHGPTPSIHKMVNKLIGTTLVPVPIGPSGHTSGLTSNIHSLVGTGDATVTVSGGMVPAPPRRLVHASIICKDTLPSGGTSTVGTAAASTGTAVNTPS